MKLFKEFQSKLLESTSVATLFPQTPTILFSPQINSCPTCDSVLHVQKTRTKSVVTLDIGAFRAKEKVLFCPHDNTVYHSKQLRSLVPCGGTFGFDIIVEVGLALFIRCRNNLEIIQELAIKKIHVSEREISYLGRKFIVYLALAHRESTARLRELQAKKGGYILHVDGTCEGDSPNLFCGLDGISEVVLDTIKIHSEKKELLIPFFQRIKKQYGEPLAIVHDMGRGIVATVEEVFPTVKDFICHFHFLRDIGKDLLLDEYTALRKRLQKFKIRLLLRQRAKYLEQKMDPDPQNLDAIMKSLECETWQTTELKQIPLITTYVLIHWVFDYPRQSNGYGFPFDRSHLDFYHRLQKVHQLLEEIKDIHSYSSIKDKSFLQIYNALKAVVEDKQLNDLAKSIEQKAAVFDTLRRAMRIALPGSNNGINDNGDTDIKSIEVKVTAFRKWLVSNEQRKQTYAKMLSQLDTYWEKLFADPLLVNTSEGRTLYIQPQRTNNLLERFFRGEKRRSRKKSGTASLSKALKAILADTPLVQNLKNHEYMEIILNGCSNLAERFSQIDTRLVQKELENANTNHEKIVPVIKNLVKNSDLTKKISLLFSSVAK